MEDNLIFFANSKLFYLAACLTWSQLGPAQSQLLVVGFHFTKYWERFTITMILTYLTLKCISHFNIERKGVFQDCGCCFHEKLTLRKKSHEINAIFSCLFQDEKKKDWSMGEWRLETRLERKRWFHEERERERDSAMG